MKPKEIEVKKMVHDYEINLIDGDSHYWFYLDKETLIKLDARINEVLRDEEVKEEEDKNFDMIREKQDHIDSINDSNKFTDEEDGIDDVNRFTGEENGDY